MKDIVGVIVVLAATVGALGEINGCLDGRLTNTKEDISSINWPESWRFNLDAGDSCWFLARMVSYAFWEDSDDITTKIES